MKIKSKIDFNKIKKQTKEEYKEKLLKFAEILKIKIDEKTPEDTRTLIWNNEMSEVIEYRNKMYIKISNDTEYAYYVEYGVGKIFNYHKWGQVFYTWEWAWFFARSIAEVEWKFKTLTK